MVQVIHKDPRVGASSKTRDALFGCGKPPEIIEPLRIEVWINVLEPSPLKVHPGSQPSKIVECGHGESLACRRMNLAAEAKVVIPPNRRPRQGRQELHGLFHSFASIEHVAEHDERSDSPRLQLVNGGGKRLDRLMNVSEKSETHDPLLRRAAAHSRVEGASFLTRRYPAKPCAMRPSCESKPRAGSKRGPLGTLVARYSADLRLRCSWIIAANRGWAANGKLCLSPRCARLQPDGAR